MGRPYPRRYVFGTLLLGAALALPGASADSAADSDPALQAYLSANGLLNRGLYELAAKEYRAFLAQHPDHEKLPVARYGLAVCYFRTGDYDRTLAELEQLARREGFEFEAEVWALLGQCRLARKEYSEAAAAFAQVVTRHVKHALADDAAALCAQALFLEGQYAETIKLCQAFVRRWPETPLRERVDYYWALALMAQDEHDEAARQLDHLLAQFPQGAYAEHATLLRAQCCHRANALEKAAQWYRRALDHPDSPYTDEALLGLAALLYGQGTLEETAELLERLLDHAADGPHSSPARLLRGRVWFDQQKYDEARQLFEQILTRKDALADRADYWAAKCMLRQGDFAAAAHRLATAIERHPQSDLLPEMHYDYAVALMRQQDFAAAADAVEQFRQRFPKHELAAGALHLAAVIAHQLQRYDDSQEYCRQFLQAHSDHELTPAVRFLSAENAYLAGHWEAALKAYADFEKHHQRDPQIKRAIFRMGMALCRLERFDEAAQRLGNLSDADLQEPEFRTALLALGDVHFRHEDWADAERRLTQYLDGARDAPAADEAWLKLGLAQQRQGRHDEALHAYQSLLDGFPDSPHRLQAIFECGQALVALGRFDQAREAFERVLAEGAASRFAAHAHNHLGAIALRQGRPQNAADHFAQVQRLQPDDALAVSAMYERGAALLRVGDFERAEKVLAKFLAENASNEHAPAARAQLAIAQSRQDRFADALQTIDRVELAGYGRLEASVQEALRYEKAWCLRKLGQTDEAAEAYRSLLNTTTGALDFHAALELAEIDAAAKRYQSAADLLRRLRTEAASAPTPVSNDVLEEAAYRLGVCEFELGHAKEAAAVLEEFIDAFPDSELLASASFFCGEALHRAGRDERAVIHFTRVVERFPDDPLRGPSLLRLGESLASLQRWPQSEQAFTDFLERYPDSDQWYQARFGVGWARENQGRYPEAIGAYRLVVARHQGPTAARAQFQIGECLFAQKQHEDAARELLKVDILYAYPEWSAAALYEAGRCFEALGKSVEARKQFKAVAENHSKTRWGELAAERLAALSANVLPGRGAGSQGEKSP